MKTRREANRYNATTSFIDHSSDGEDAFPTGEAWKFDHNTGRAGNDSDNLDSVSTYSITSIPTSDEIDLVELARYLDGHGDESKMVAKSFQTPVATGERRKRQDQGTKENDWSAKASRSEHNNRDEYGTVNKQFIQEEEAQLPSNLVHTHDDLPFDSYATPTPNLLKSAMKNRLFSQRLMGRKYQQEVELGHSPRQWEDKDQNIHINENTHRVDDDRDRVDLDHDIHRVEEDGKTRRVHGTKFADHENPMFASTPLLRGSKKEGLNVLTEHPHKPLSVTERRFTSLAHQLHSMSQELEESPQFQEREIPMTEERPLPVKADSVAPASNPTRLVETANIPTSSVDMETFTKLMEKLMVPVLDNSHLLQIIDKLVLSQQSPKLYEQTRPAILEIPIKIHVDIQNPSVFGKRDVEVASNANLSDASTKVGELEIEPETRVHSKHAKLPNDQETLAAQPKKSFPEQGPITESNSIDIAESIAPQSAHHTKERSSKRDSSNKGAEPLKEAVTMNLLDRPESNHKPESSFERSGGCDELRCLKAFLRSSLPGDYILRQFESGGVLTGDVPKSAYREMNEYKREKETEEERFELEQRLRASEKEKLEFEEHSIEEKVKLEERLKISEDEKHDLRARLETCNREKSNLEGQLKAGERDKHGFNERIKFDKDEKTELEERWEMTEREKSEILERLAASKETHKHLNEELETMKQELSRATRMANERMKSAATKEASALAEYRGIMAEKQLAEEERARYETLYHDLLSNGERADELVHELQETKKQLKQTQALLKVQMSNKESSSNTKMIEFIIALQTKLESKSRQLKRAQYELNQRIQKH
ncbi:hypothetical protein BABINDRAFT_168468 [Babjeviella inositovora NRRL Y-12698]|uniref:Uncharacterized protein n=1 Tax=Babjeviella inositovora NRRL Y-12698 TaxID=984486 RepID=A0A1E3QMH5_9ASCO|nr:uncharacterized protein BABINDRAFT_168468 [Babjeviella inositovora NRRL Y-12698]ODQ78292.1 hypothetical protein BABINDRAFT_168468 [Babjeviella inositovora NRRL Y-12698]